MKKYLILMISGVIGFSHLFAQDAGDYGSYMTYWGPSARSLGMAGVFSGLADDASAGYFNPAGLVQLNTQELTFMHSLVFAGNGVSADVLMYARPVSATSAFGITVFHLYTPKVERRSELNEKKGYYTDRQVCGLLTYCNRLLGPVWMGFNGKLAHHMMDIWSRMGFGLDVGLYFFPAQPFSLGLNVQNAVKPGIKLSDEENKFSSTLRSGFSIRPWGDKMAIVVDMTWTEARSPVFGMGIEYRPFPMLYFRTGFTPAFGGLGLGLWKDQRTYEVRFDYSIGLPVKAGGAFGFAHNFSLSLLFGGYRAKAFSPIVAFSPTSGEEGKNVAWIYFNVEPRTEVRKWQILIKDETGTVVRKIEAWGEPPYRVAWDGKDDNSILVPDGRYYYSMRVVEIDGRTWDHEGFLASMYTVGPPGTVIIKHKGERPEYILEERRKEKKETERRKERARRRRRGRRRRR